LPQLLADRGEPGATRAGGKKREQNLAAPTLKVRRAPIKLHPIHLTKNTLRKEERGEPKKKKKFKIAKKPKTGSKGTISLAYMRKKVRSNKTEFGAPSNYAREKNDPLQRVTCRHTVKTHHHLGKKRVLGLKRTTPKHAGKSPPFPQPKEGRV